MFEGWKIRQKLSSDVVQKFEQANTISLQFGNAFICRCNFTFFLLKNRLKDGGRIGRTILLESRNIELNMCLDVCSLGFGKLLLQSFDSIFIFRNFCRKSVALLL
jgi:hypothetical protein